MVETVGELSVYLDCYFRNLGNKIKLPCNESVVFLAVVRCAFRDALIDYNAEVRSEAEKYISSRSVAFEWYCDMIGLESEQIRKKYLSIKEITHPDLKRKKITRKKYSYPLRKRNEVKL